MPIVTDVAALTKPCEPFDFDNPPIDPNELAVSLVKQMQEHSGIGLAANQVGHPYRVFAIAGYPENFVVFNPKIVNYSEEENTLEEGCLSWPGIYVKVPRSKTIRIRFQGPDGQTYTRTFKDMTAKIIQHEIEHLDGKFFFSNVSKLRLSMALKKAKKSGFDYSDKGLLKFAK